MPPPFSEQSVLWNHLKSRREITCSHAERLRQAVRVRWSAQLWLRTPMTGSMSVAHVDGVSVYELDARGFVKTHRLESIARRGQQQHELQMPSLAGLGFAPSPELAVPF